ncbi:hypothetical protein HG536_0B04540 [Torulaspora globosa]|uniref:HTH APSES-type domain-containing protein n=1 Tax=Torulaspora globosa TaxID=48254 RepID=A0A7G3ZDK4_9SACH|nr:uncharacterized protein HG536_0B04540 [Torulaspora globosa]QLL31590.1 hypothetical protein HG536_0B04540 [Torulaspora globosa]
MAGSGEEISEAGVPTTSGAGEAAGLAPVIEVATYAETDVYECYIRGYESRIVMRRTQDDWVNITQVFKIAQFSKTQRTKVLEKESNDMRHEKVQGGYGRFQGTWIPLENAKYMVSKYNIRDPVVNRILEFKLDPQNPPVKRSKNSVLKRSSPNGRISSPSSYNKTPKKKQYPNSAVARKVKKTGTLLQPNPSPLQNLVFQTPQQPRLNSQNANATVSASTDGKKHQSHSVDAPVTMGYSATQKPLQFYPVPTSISHSQKQPRNSAAFHHQGSEVPQSSFLTFIPEGPTSGTLASGDQNQTVPNIMVNGSLKQPSRKRKKVRKFSSMSAIKIEPSGMQDKAQQNFKLMNRQMWQNVSPNASHPNPINTGISNTHSNTSSLEMFSTQENPTPMSSRSSTPHPFGGIPTAPSTAVENDDVLENAEMQSLSVAEYKDAILQVLSLEDGSDKNYSLPPQMYHPPSDFDINFLIDDQGHTPLHWATAMANIPLIKLLIALNANALLCNSKGFNCITKSVFYNNCFKAGSFPEIVSLLRICLITPDSNGRLPLHYLVELSVNKSKDPIVINSYMDTIIQNLGQDDSTLLRMCLNFQDNLGNTILHLAALNLNLELCNKLCCLGSSMDITNYENETPASILAKFNLVPPTTIAQAFSPRTSNKLPLYSEMPAIVPADGKTAPRDLAEQTAPALSPVENLGILGRTPQIRLTPAGPTKKTSTRNFLSGTDSATFTTLMDDLSNIDSFVTSSAIRDVKTTPSRLLESSPILFKKRPNTSAMLPPPSFKKFAKLAEAMESPLGPVTMSPLPGTANVKELNDVLMAADRLKDVANTLVASVNTQANSIAAEVERTEKSIAQMKNNLAKTKNSEKELLAQFDGSEGTGSVDDLKKSTLGLRQLVEDSKQQFVQCIERSQALNLASLVQDEESKVNDDSSQSPSSEKAQLESTMKHAIELAFLQLRRRSTLSKIIDSKCRVNTSNKISKYRRLIGMAVDNIDTKLDEIELDLRTNA